MGDAYRNKGEPDNAILNYQAALDIQKAIADSGSNIYKIHDGLALSYLYKRDLVNAYEEAMLSKNMITLSLAVFQLFNQQLLSGDIDAAQQCLKSIGIDFVTSRASGQLVKFEITCKNEFLSKNMIEAVVDTQKALVILDPKLEYGNHYHDLACFLAVEGNLVEAYETFNTAWMQHREKVTDGFCVEYAQFLILNAKALEAQNILVTKDQITELLYSTIASENTSGLSYSQAEKNNVVSLIKELLSVENKVVIIQPKSLAYYLLITHPQYLVEGENLDYFIDTFKNHCNELKDSVSLVMLDDVCKELIDTDQEIATEIVPMGESFDESCQQDYSQ